MSNPYRKPHRKEALIRDRGQCAQCDLDTEWLGRIVHHARDHYRFFIGRKDEKFMPLLLVALGFKPDSPLWEADHTEGLAEDGEDSIDNIQTLCVPCHESKTAVGTHERAKGERLDRKRARAMNQPDKAARLASKAPKVRVPGGGNA